ncbi:MAG: hypothetical protein ABUT20_48980 [Bacteroidota bacterium]
MKPNVTPSQVKMGKDELKVLLSEVKETVAKDAIASTTQSFGQVDIWNIRRSMKTARSLWDK